MIKNIVVAAALLSAGLCRGQSAGWHAAVEYLDLYSTHRDHFRGASLIAGKFVTPSIQLGVGAEYTAAPFHFDNDWNLYRLRFVPVFADEQLHIHKEGRFHPLVHLSEGVSYNSYKKEILAIPGVIQQIHEVGVYAYAGTGFRWRIYRKVSLAAEVGIKGFRFSFNSLDVNPHGVAGRVGLVL